ncbi:MAG: hydrogenase [Melioribacteraceae bacterium]|nr:hydrogenase [Melioribacteraceae bacterium]
MKSNNQYKMGRKLVRLGLILFLLGLVTGLLIPVLENPRMGLSSHLEGTLNGMLLILFGLIWEKLNLTEKLLTWSFWLALIGTFTNWFTTLLAAAWGAGAEMMPIAGGDYTGSEIQEIIIKTGLVVLTLAILSVSVILVVGMKEKNN